MTVKQLYNWCKAQKDKNAEVYMVKDWEEVDEEGYLTDLYRLSDIVTQTQYVDMGLDFEVNTEVLLVFETKKAGPTVNREY